MAEQQTMPLIPQETNVLQSFSDATIGRSMQLFYGVGTNQSTGIVYFLSRDSGLSSPTSTGTTAGVTSTFDIDFDVTINKPTVLAGIGVLDYRMQETTNNRNASIAFTLYHVRGGVETSIGTVTSPTIAAVGTASYKSKLTVTRKMFGVGDTLRLNVIATISDSGGVIILHHNPQIAGDEFKIWIPVVNLE